jgi:hypothetical protein
MRTTIILVALIVLLIWLRVSWNVGFNEGYDYGVGEGISAGWRHVRNTASRMDIIAEEPITLSGEYQILSNMRILLIEQDCSAIRVESGATNSLIDSNRIEMLGSY